MLTERSRPTFHVGSFLAEKIEKELSNAALEMPVISLTADGRLWPEICQRKDFTRALFTFVNWPRTDTSKQNTSTLNPTERSLISGAYFRTFKLWLVSTLESQGTVSSNKTTLRNCRFTKNKSGRWLVQTPWFFCLISFYFFSKSKSIVCRHPSFFCLKFIANLQCVQTPWFFCLNSFCFFSKSKFIVCQHPSFFFFKSFISFLIPNL